MEFQRRVLKNLLEWKQKSSRKPLVLRGARQVGKTSLLRYFGRKYYQETFYINLEQGNDYKFFGSINSVPAFLQAIELYFGKKFDPNSDLIFIDEIQNSVELIKLLRFFYEDRPDINLVTAGSLLESRIRAQQVSMPVGRVEYLYLYPLDFFEFLDATGSSQLKDLLEGFEVNLDGIHFDLPENIHELADRKLGEYMLIGGMPQIVKEYRESGSVNVLRTTYSSLFQSYLEDSEKYAGKSKALYLRHVLNTSPLAAGSIYSYQNFGASNFRSSEMSEAFSLLESTMLLHEIPVTDSSLLPLTPRLQRNKKLLFLDIGFVNFKSGNEVAAFEQFQLEDNFRGRLAEQFVGQNLIAQFSTQPQQLRYWSKGTSNSIAEVDFVFANSGRVMAVEVKSGTSGRLRSLFRFIDENPGAKAIRLYRGLPKVEKASYAGREYEFASLPAYLAPILVNLK